MQSAPIPTVDHEALRQIAGSLRQMAMETPDELPRHRVQRTLEDFRSMVQAVRDRGARIVYVVPPLYEPLYEVNRASYAAYLDTIRRALPPAPVIDFDGPEYASLRSDPDNFRDCFHLNPTGAATFTALLEKLVPEAIAYSN